MRPRFRSAFAVVAGVLLVATATFGGVVGPGSSPVETANAQGLAEVATTPTFGAALVEKVSSIFTNSPDTDELAGLDAQETKQSIYDEASIQQQNNELVNTAYSNYLNDTESIALREGKNAYIRALENGSAESVARNKATEAVSDYYSVKQKNLIASWNTSVTVVNNSFATVMNTSNISADFITVGNTVKVDDPHLGGVAGAYQTPVETETLANGTNANVLGITVDSKVYTGSQDLPLTVTPTGGNTGTMQQNDAGGSETHTAFNITVRPPTSNFDKLEVLDFSEFSSRWTEIEQQNDEVQASLDSFINNTYDSYQQGDINTSDLVDPYLGARDYDPETSDTWTMRSLSSMGIEPPENLSNVGRMNVSAGGTTYTGTLMSDGTPDGGYAVGGTYDAANITGAQFVALDDGGAQELDGEFTLESVETADGEQLAQNETVEYKEINYQTANTSEFKALQEDLDELTAEINAKQQQARNAGGGGFLPDFGSGGAIPGALILGGAVVLLLNRS